MATRRIPFRSRGVLVTCTLVLLPFAALSLANRSGVTARVITQEARQRSFVLGAARGDNIEPFARFTGTAWVNTWPMADDRTAAFPQLAQVPIAWLDKPVPRAWTVWRNGRPTQVVVSGTRRDPGGCAAPIDLTLDRKVFGEFTSPAGLAVDSDQAIAGIHRGGGC